MKKIISLVSALVLLLGMVSCDSNGAFEISKSAYEKVINAYELVNMYSEDVYQAWKMSVEEKDSIDGSMSVTSYMPFSSFGTKETIYDDSDALDCFADGLNISKKDLEKAVSSMLGKSRYESGSRTIKGDWYILSSEEYTSFSSACVDVVSEVYKMNGTVEEIQILLDDTKVLMKQLNDDHSDYEHYPDLKEIFITTSSLFSFCQNPDGSLENTINDYRNKARDYYYDLSYVFEESEIADKKEEE